MGNSAEDHDKESPPEPRCAWPSDELREAYKFLLEGYTCPHEIKHKVGDERHCIFHLPLEEKRRHPPLAEEFKREFKSLFDEGGRDFRGFEFPDKMSFKEWDFRPPSKAGVTGNQEQEESLPVVDFFLAVFGNAASFQSAIFGDGTDFYRVTFGDGAHFSDATFGDGTYFGGATFGRRAGFRATTFGLKTVFVVATFGEGAAFSRATFGNDTRFHHATFGDDAQFEKATFGDSARFDDAIFGDLGGYRDILGFRGATFGDSAGFVRATFGDGAMFEGATFGDDAAFFRAAFGDDASFKDATFGHGARFDEADFKGVVLFQGIRGEDRTPLKPRHRPNKNSTKEKGNAPAVPAYDIILSKPVDISFRKTKCQGPALFHEADLSRIRFQQVDLANVSFLNSRIAETRLISCQWGKGLENPEYWWPFRFRRPRLLFDERLWRAKKREEPILIEHYRSSERLEKEERAKVEAEMHLDGPACVRREWPYTLERLAIGPEDLNASDIEVLALQLKESLERTKDPIPAGDFHFAVMEMKLEQAKEQKHRWRTISLWLYKMLNGYGERAGRALGWFLSIIAITALLLIFVTGTSVNEALTNAIQHSLPLKFAAKASAAASPHGFSYWFKHWLNIIETIIGTSLFTLFILALRTRFRR